MESGLDCEGEVEENSFHHPCGSSCPQRP